MLLGKNFSRSSESVVHLPEQLSHDGGQRKALTLLEPVEPLIHGIRKERVMLDSDLARIYGVPTKVLNQAVKRNADRFPPDFVFRLTEEEFETVNRSQSVTASPHASDMRSQTVTASKRNVRFLPFAFTEHGAIMAANVLNSPRAVEMSPAMREHSRPATAGSPCAARRAVTRPWRASSRSWTARKKFTAKTSS